MEIRLGMNSVSMLFDELGEFEDVVLPPVYKNEFANVQEMQEYNRSLRRYWEYCEKNNLPKVNIFPPWPQEDFLFVSGDKRDSKLCLFNSQYKYRLSGSEQAKTNTRAIQKGGRNEVRFF